MNYVKSPSSAQSIAPITSLPARIEEKTNIKNKIEIEAISDLHAIYGLEAEWLRLEKQAPNSVLFQSWHWNKYFLEYCENDDDYVPLIITIRLHNKLVGLLPLKITRLRGMRLVTGLSEPYQQYTEMLVANEINIDLMRGEFLNFAKSMTIDYWHFGQVREDGDLAQLLDGVARPSGECDASPYVEISKWDDFASYHKSIKTKTRKNMRNAVNRLARSNPVEHHFASDGELLTQVINRTFVGRKAWLKRLGITSRAFNDQRFAEFLTGFNNVEKTGIEVLAMSLTHGETPIADQWGYVYNGRYYAFMASWDEGYEESSPGKLHLGRVIETCYEMDLDVVDFMIPDVDYKRTWAANAAPVRDYVRASSVKGYLYTQAWIGILRPFAKKMLYSFTPALRQIVMKFASPFMR